MSGNLRFLYHALQDCETGDAWWTVFKKSWSELSEICAYYEALRNRPCEVLPWPCLSDEEGWCLYSASRLSDLMLLRCQGDSHGPSLSIENYLEFFEHIGFSHRQTTSYHPFDCEVVAVVEGDGSGVEICEIKWPSLMLGNMMFVRAGVVVQAPQSLLVKGVSDASTLYWSHRRKYRSTRDLSMGWGSNSQWRTSFRRDFELSDRYAYNVDGCLQLKDLRAAVDEQGMEGFTAQERIDFLRHRCLTKHVHDDRDLWPYDDYFEEPRPLP